MSTCFVYVLGYNQVSVLQANMSRISVQLSQLLDWPACSPHPSCVLHLCTCVSGCVS